MEWFLRPSAQRRYGYNISAIQFDALLMAQCGKCAICGEVMTAPHVDHDHETGIIRGLLCRQCNVGIGALGDKAINLQNAVDYLA